MAAFTLFLCHPIENVLYNFDEINIFQLYISFLSLFCATVPQTSFRSHQLILIDFISKIKKPANIIVLIESALHLKLSQWVRGRPRIIAFICGICKKG